MKTTYKNKSVHRLLLMVTIVVIPCFVFAQAHPSKKITGVYSQQQFYRFIIVEFEADCTFNYHVMSERAHQNTRGRYDVRGDTIILNSFEKKSDFDFVNEHWLILSRKKLLISNNLEDRHEQWSILHRSKEYCYVPIMQSDLSLQIDSIMVNELSWIQDTTNYDTELKVIIREPLPPKEPLVVLDGMPVRYKFLLNYYTIDEIESIDFLTGEKAMESGLHGGQAEYGLIIVNTK